MSSFLNQINRMYQTDIPMPEIWDRKAVLDLYQQHEFGVTPQYDPKNTSFRVDSEEQTSFGALCRKITVTIAKEEETYSFPVTLYLPEGKTNCPAFLMITKHNMLENYRFLQQDDTGFFPVQEIIKRGYGAILLTIDEIGRDNQQDFEDYKDGLYRFLQIDSQAPDAMAAIGLWAFSASRVMDCLAQIAEIDETKVAVVGHSRFGKTALWTGAQDERFCLAISNNSGCGGAANFRSKGGERIAFMAELIPYWFCPRYQTYAHRETELPFDQHMLLGLMAPRAVYVSSSGEDYWADPEAEFVSTRLAAEIFQQVCGEESFSEDKIPSVDSAIFGDRIGYHLKTGSHSLTYVDWEYFLDFMDDLIAK